jgi:uncharacterized protein
MGEQERLLALQECDLRIRATEREMQDIPARQEQERLRLQELRDRIVQAEEELKLSESAVKQLELESESHREKIKKFRHQQLGLKSNKEFKAMEAEIRAEEREIERIETRELTRMEAVEQARARVRGLKAELAEAQAEIDQAVARLDARLKELDTGLDALRTEREAAARVVDPQWLAHYEHVAAHREQAFVQLRDGVCGGCHMTLPPAIAHATRKTEIVCCPYCQRMLY